MRMTVKQHWERFSRIIPHNAPAIQRYEMKRAFYAGMLSGFAELVSLSELPEDEAVACLDNFKKEIDAEMMIMVMEDGVSGHT